MNMTAPLSLATLLACLLPLTAPAAENGPRAAAATPDKKVVYKTLGDTSLQLHVFNPKGHQASDQRPVIIFFFGGGWVSGSPSQFYPHCAHLAGKGMVAIAAEYRVKKTHHTTPLECVKDGKSAIRWVRQHAAELGIDPKRVAAGGGSAGGHVAAATGHTTGFEEDGEDPTISTRPNALVLFNPVLDNGPDGWGHKQVREYWKNFSPLHNITKEDPPAIVFLGTKDKLIPVSAMQDYQQRMKALDIRCELKLYQGEGHGFFNANKGDGSSYTQTVAEMDQFLTSLGYLK